MAEIRHTVRISTTKRPNNAFGPSTVEDEEFETVVECSSEELMGVLNVVLFAYDTKNIGVLEQEVNDAQAPMPGV